MAVNPAIAMGVRGIELQDPLAQYGRVAAIQSAQQQQQMNALQMRQAQKEQEDLNALNRAYSQSLDPQTGEIDINRLRSALAGGGLGSKLPAVEKQFGELKTQKLAQQKTEGEVLDAALKRQKSFLDMIDSNDPDAPSKFVAWNEAAHRDPIIGPALKAQGITPEQALERTMQAISQGPQAFNNLLQEYKLGAQKFIELNKPQLSTTDIGGTVVSRTFEPLTRKVTTVGELEKTMAPGEAERLEVSRQQVAQQAQRIKQEGQRIGLEGRRVAVLEENARRDADPTFQRRMEAARVEGRKAAEGDVAAVQALPKVISRAEENIRLIDELIGKRDSKTGKLIEGSKPHPGFEAAVGATWIPGARFIPGTDAASFMSRYDQIKGASFLEAFESLKGGGAITEKEGQKGTDAINRMSTSTDEKEFIRAAMDLQEVIRKGVANAQARVNRVSTPTGVPASGGVKFLGFE